MNCTQTAPNLTNCNNRYTTHACYITHSGVVSDLLRSQTQPRLGGMVTLKQSKLETYETSKSPSFKLNNCTRQTPLKLHKTLSIAGTDRYTTYACYITHSSLVSDLLRSQIEPRLGGIVAFTLMWRFVSALLPGNPPWQQRKELYYNSLFSGGMMLAGKALGFAGVFNSNLRRCHQEDLLKLVFFKDVLT